jgi:anti-sigma regulatory factor (Ser/Thr protein kinase)
MLRILIPTIKDDDEGFSWLFGLCRRLKDYKEDVTFDFSRSSILYQNAVAFLGGMIRLLQRNGAKVFLDRRSLNSQVKSRLMQNGFFTHFGLTKTKFLTGHSIAYREEKNQEKDSQIAYLKNEWLGKGWIHISELLTNAIVSKVWELYANAFEHGKSLVGVFICGQHYPQDQSLKLTFIDFGVGIPVNVRTFLNDPTMSDAQAMKWAFVSGHTTVRDEIGRGLGLHLIREFIKANSGHMEIYSHNGCVRIEKGQDTYSLFPVFFPGTIINITLICDEKYYKFSTESDDRPLF